MSPFEIGIIITICCLPILALIMVLPKKIKKNKSKNVEPPKIEPIKEVSTPTEQKQELQKSEQKLDDDMHKFLDDRKQSHPAPNAKDGDLNKFGKYNSDLFRTPTKQSFKSEKSIAEQINDLSPELKALMLSGALERKNFDDNNT